MKKTLFLALLTLGLIFAAPSVRAETINDFNTAVVVKGDGAISVKETIVYDFGLTGIHHGIYRDIPTQKQNQNGKWYRMDITVGSIADENGVPYAYTTSYTGTHDDLHLKIGSASRTVEGVKTYIISYVVKGAITYFSDHDELYWNMTGNSWTVPIEKAGWEIALPSGVPSDKVSQKCYTGAAGSTASGCLIATADGTFSGSSATALGVGEGVTVAVSFPPGFVAHVEPVEVVSFWNTVIGKITLTFIILLAILWYTLLPIAVPVIWYLWGRDPQAGQGPVSAWFDPPKDKTGRPLTPGETGLLVDESVDMRDLFASIIQLAQRGYLKIVEKKKDDYYFVKGKEYSGDSSLADFERELLEGIFTGETRSLSFGDALSDIAGQLTGGKTRAASGEVRIKTLDMSSQIAVATDKLYKGMTKAGFFPENPQSVRNKWYVLAALALGTGNFFLAVELFIFARIMPKKTVFGVQQANVGKSLKNFLGSQERQLEFQAKNQMFFEKLLPFAIAFGVEKVWADRFKDITLRSPDWYQGYGNRSFTTGYLMGSMNSSFSSFRTSATPVRSSSGFSSGSSGGFSGGGGGGGGGGSW